jgi:hypothetical protein
MLKVNCRTTTKAYLSIFVCLATKAVHLEVVSELSTQAFIGALNRFIARRGLCNHIYSNNGGNFIGAKKIKALTRTGRDEKRTIVKFFNRKINFCNWDGNGNLEEEVQRK